MAQTTNRRGGDDANRKKSIRLHINHPFYFIFFVPFSLSLSLSQVSVSCFRSSQYLCRCTSQSSGRRAESLQIEQVQYSAVQYSIGTVGGAESLQIEQVRYSAVQYSIGPVGKSRIITNKTGTIQCSTVQYRQSWRRAELLQIEQVQYSTVQVRMEETRIITNRYTIDVKAFIKTHI